MFSQTMSLFKNEYYRCILYSKKLLIQFPCYNLNIHSQNRTCFLQSENFPYTHKTHKHVNILQCHICNLTSVDREAHFTYFTQDAHHMTTALPGQRTCLIKNTHTHAFPKWLNLALCVMTAVRRADVWGKCWSCAGPEGTLPFSPQSSAIQTWQCGWYTWDLRLLII